MSTVYVVENIFPGRLPYCLFVTKTCYLLSLVLIKMCYNFEKASLYIAFRLYIVYWDTLSCRSDVLNFWSCFDNVIGSWKSSANHFL